MRIHCALCVRSSMSSFAAGTDAVGMGGRIAISTLARLSLLRRTCRHGRDGERLLSCGVRPSLQDRYFKRPTPCVSLWRRHESSFSPMVETFPRSGFEIEN